MAAVVTVTGSSNSGKTTFVERVVPVLRARGLTIGSVKHASHGYTADRSGSDSDRHQVAGASPVLLVGPSGHVLFSTEQASVSEAICRHFGSVDLVLVEGLVSRPGPKVLIHRREIPPKGVPDRDEVLFAMTDEPLGYQVELGPDDIEAAVDLLEAHLAAHRAATASARVELRVDGDVVELDDELTTRVSDAVLGALRDAVPSAALEIELRLKLT
jgi:molybdopterin-guanine dinucleotide biosynthesis protein B